MPKKSLLPIALSFATLAFVGCSPSDEPKEEPKASGHILSTSVEKKDNTFTLHAIYSSPEYAGISSIKPSSFNSEMKVFAKLRSSVQAKEVSEGYSVDVKCTYEYLSLASKDYYNLECDDLNDNSDSTSSRSLSADELLVARWSEYGKDEAVEFGALSEFAFKDAKPADTTQQPNQEQAAQTDPTKLSGIYSGIYNNTTVEVNFDTNTTTYPSLGCTTHFEVTEQTTKRAILAEELVEGECRVDTRLYITKYEDNTSKVKFKNDTIYSSGFELYSSTHKDGFTNIKGSADQLLSSTINYTPKGFEIHATLASQANVNLFVEYDETNLYKEDTLLAGDITTIAKDNAFGVDINCTYTDKENSRTNTLLCDDMNSQEDNPLEIAYPTTKPLWLSWNNLRSYQAALLNINFSQAGMFDEAAYNQRIRDEEAAAYAAALAEAESNATTKYRAMSPYVVTSKGVGNNAKNFVVDGSYIYVASGEDGLEVLKIENNNTLSHIATKDTSDAQDVKVDGDYAYIADGEAGLKVIDISNPSSPKIRGIVDTNGTAVDVLVDGDYAYVSNGYSEDKDRGLKVVDISDKENPSVVGYEKDLAGILKKGDYIYGSYGYSIDVSDPTDPQTVDRISDNYNFRAIVGDHIITQNTTVDITDPTDMKEDGNFTTFYDYVNDIKVVDGIGYVANGWRGLTLLDISDLSNINYVANMRYGLNSVYKVDVSDGYAYVLSTDSYDRKAISKINIDKKTSPVIPVASKKGYKAVKDNTLYNIDDNTLTISSIDDTNITTISTLGLEESIYAFSGKGISLLNDTLYYLFVNSDNRGLAAVDISDSENPKNLTTFDLDGSICSIKIVGNYAYIAAESAGLHIVDVSDAKNLELVGTLDDDNFEAAYDIAIKGDYAFVSNGSGLAVVDISDVAHPTFVKGFYTDYVRNIKIDGDYLYVSRSSRFITYDISTPNEPKLLGDTHIKGYGPIELVGDYAVCGNSESTASIIDITNKAFPIEVGYFYDMGDAQQVVGDYLFTKDYMFDVSKLRGE